MEDLNQEENTTNLKIAHDSEEWLDKHGKPSFVYLQSLIDDGNPDAIETLKRIAEDLDIHYNEETPPDELLELIILSQKNL